jgi:hypothetical protein
LAILTKQFAMLKLVWGVALVPAIAAEGVPAGKQRGASRVPAGVPAKAAEEKVRMLLFVWLFYLA